MAVRLEGKGGRYGDYCSAFRRGACACEESDEREDYGCDAEVPCDEGNPTDLNAHRELDL